MFFESQRPDYDFQRLLSRCRLCQTWTAEELSNYLLQRLIEN